MKNLKELILFFKNKNLNKYALEIYKLAAPAEPFLDWFEGQERVYLPYKLSPEQNESKLRERHPFILEAAKYMGYEESSISLFKKSLDINARSQRRVRIALPFFTRFFEKKLNDLLKSEDDDLKKELTEKFLNIFWGSSYLTQVPKMIQEFRERLNIKQFIKIQNELIDIIAKFKEYDSDDLRETSISNDDKIVVISRAEEDIINMSTGRRWTSCMNVDSGSNSDGPYCEVKNGGFIAYLTSSDDKELRDPYSRVLIRRFDSQNTGESVAVVEESIYGQEDASFLEIVKSWVKDKQGDIEVGSYELIGMEWSDEYKPVEIFGLSKEVSHDEIIKNPNSIFNYSEVVYLVSDSLSIPDIKENIPEIAKEIGVFDGYKIFLNEEDFDNFINQSQKKVLDLKEKILNAISDEEEKDLIREKIEEEDRYYFSEISKEAYFDNINRYQPKLFDAIINYALNSSMANPNSLSKESMEKIRKKKDIFETKNTYKEFILANPDNANQEDLAEIVKHMTKSFSYGTEKLPFGTIDGRDTRIREFKKIFHERVKGLGLILSNSSNEELKKDIEEKIQKGLDLIISSGHEIDNKINLLLLIVQNFSKKDYFGGTESVPINLDNVYDFISKINKKELKWSNEFDLLKGYLIYSKDLSEDTLKGLFESIYRIDIMFENPVDGGYGVSSIDMGKPYARGSGTMNSKTFLKIISKNNNSEVLSEEIDQVLEQLSKKINKIIDAYKRNISWAEGKGLDQVIRYFLKNLKSELNEVSKFSRELLEIIK